MYNKNHMNVLLDLNLSLYFNLIKKASCILNNKHGKMLFMAEQFLANLVTGYLQFVTKTYRHHTFYIKIKNFPRHLSLFDGLFCIGLYETRVML